MSGARLAVLAALTVLPRTALRAAIMVLCAAIIVIAIGAGRDMAIAGSGAFAASSASGRAYAACVRESVLRALACAVAQCRELAAQSLSQPDGGQNGREAGCEPVAACMPAGWSGAMRATLGEFHYTNTICGAPSRAAALEALAAYCKGHLPEVLECVIVALWSPDGAVEEVEILLKPGDNFEQADENQAGGAN